MSTVTGLGAAIIDGKLVDSAGAIAGADKNASGGNNLGKDAFLQLLVAQMKYQDPLEPTSNTEFISQYATFSQLEQMQNMSATLELSRASSYVGQTVTVRTKMAAGDYREIEGKVDFVIFENNKALLSIDGSLYRAEDVYATVDPAYKTAYDLAMAFAVAVNSLPSLDNLQLSDGEFIDNLKDGYNAMSGYQQGFIATELLDRLRDYVAALDAMRAAANPPEEPEEAEEPEDV